MPAKKKKTKSAAKKPGKKGRETKSTVGKPRRKDRAGQSRPRPKTNQSVAEKKRAYFKQADFPQTDLQQAQRIAAAIVDSYGGTEASPPDIALAIDVSPTSSAWPHLAGSSIAYGLTEGGVNASAIRLTDLGRRLVEPQEEGEDIAARREAILQPSIQRDFFKKYHRSKLPSDIIASNVLKGMGLPASRLESAVEIIKTNGKYAGIIKETKTGPFVHLDSPNIPPPTVTSSLSTKDENDPDDTPDTTEVAAGASAASPDQRTSDSIDDEKSSRVFITHGKQRAIVEQIKELLAFGKFDPIVSVERESTAIPVPEKVFEDMRACSAGVIHVGAEGEYLDSNGEQHTKINDNVLIEIGAAMALYGKRIVLLVEKGVVLPSNLQGLYRCEFDGDQLDYDATMKLLKTFSQFR